jgi:hypothetical protein
MPAKPVTVIVPRSKAPIADFDIVLFSQVLNVFTRFGHVLRQWRNSSHH